MPFLFLFRVLIVVCTIWVIYDVWTNSKKETPIKILWTVLALAFSIVTAIIYAITQKK